MPAAGVESLAREPVVALRRLNAARTAHSLLLPPSRSTPAHPRPYRERALLLLDEPTSGLDTVSALEMIETLQRYAATGRSVVLTLHQPRADIFASFDTLWLVHRGRFAFAGPPLEGAVMPAGF